MYTFIETAKIDGIDPRGWLPNVLARPPDHPVQRISQLLPWNWSAPELQRIARLNAAFTGRVRVF